MAATTTTKTVCELPQRSTPQRECSQPAHSQGCPDVLQFQAVQMICDRLEELSKVERGLVFQLSDVVDEHALNTLVVFTIRQAESKQGSNIVVQLTA
jgi:hypothetical protein